MGTSKKKKAKRGAFWKNKVARRFAIAGSVFLYLMVAFGIAGLIWPEAFYGCRDILYRPHGDVSAGYFIMVRSSQHCSPMALGWLTAISGVCAAGCWLIAAIWNWLGDSKKKSLRVIKLLLTDIPIYEMILAPILLLFWTVCTDEWLEVISYQALTMLEMAVAAMLLAGLLLAVLWLILLIVAAVLARNEKRRA